MSDSPYLSHISRTRSRKSIFTEEFDSQYSLPYFELELDMATSPTPRDIRRLASDHDFVLAAHPAPRRLGWWPFVATHLSLPTALTVGIIFVVVAIVYTAKLSNQVLECPSWANACPTADNWTIENLGTVQGIITMVYLIGMVALAYAALGLCEATVWPLLHVQSFTIRGLDAYLSTTRGSIMSAPAAVMSVRSVAAGFILASAFTVTLLPFVAPPLVGHAYSSMLQPIQLESNYAPSGGISELYAQTNPPTSVLVRLIAEYNALATDPTSEPMPDFRDWYIDRKALSERGDFAAKAVRLQTNVSCRPNQVQQLIKNNQWWNAFLTNMSRTNNATQAGKNSSAEVWIRPEAQLTLWADSFEFISERRTRTTLVFTALDGTIEGGNTTSIFLGNLTTASSIACDVEIEAVNDILTVGTNAPTTSPDTLPILSSTSTLTLNPATPPQTRLNELLLWFTVAPLLTSPSVDGTQPTFTNSSITHLPLPYTSSPLSPNTNTWTTTGLENFIRLSISALAQSTSSSPSNNPPSLTILTAPHLPTLSYPLTLLLLFPPLLAITLILLLALYTTHLHSSLAIPVMRLADLAEVLKSAQADWVREVGGTDAAKGYLPSELGGERVRFGVEGGVVGFVEGVVGPGDGKGKGGGFVGRG